MTNIKYTCTKESFLFILDKISRNEVYNNHKRNIKLCLENNEQYIYSEAPLNKQTLNQPYIKPVDCLYENIINYIHQKKYNIDTPFIFTGKKQTNQLIKNVKYDFIVYSILDKLQRKCFDSCGNILRREFTNILQTFEDNIFIETAYRINLIKILLNTIKINRCFNNKFNNYIKSNYKYFNNVDLMTNDISKIPLYRKIILYQNSKKYVFDICNLLKMINKKLLYQEYYEPYPSKITNPYTNVQLNKEELYAIYLFCDYNHISIPQSFILFMKEDFSYNNFLLRHHVYLQNEGIKASYNSMTLNEKTKHLYDLLNDGDFKNILNIENLILYVKNDNDKVDFLNIEIQDYLIYTYSLNDYIAQKKRCVLKAQLLKKNRMLIERILESTAFSK